MLTRLITLTGIIATSILLIACGDGPLGPCQSGTEARQAQGENLLQFNCADVCHASTLVGEAREGAPDGMFFDTTEEKLKWAEEIYESVSRTENPMPPNGGLTRNQIENVRLFLACGLE